MGRGMGEKGRKGKREGDRHVRPRINSALYSVSVIKLILASQLCALTPTLTCAKYGFTSLNLNFHQYYLAK